ncbi:bifunctional glycosyltransferase/CDP-glycerol:glycerophosphate glycerophosphotransferase [Nonomuraea typhae]|uniref:bifunctional glycosyltransferase/CDP-glycerol:glycerophosphate glycerophosphotransferase n=1 Tax=Nonomuraea typhae TaxID=2603600 RepID=UPI0012FC322B|nr:bifunctional glycosyltransferase family 2 protein/CDP-glycerol:glycerophosphate glycerophosphotransferase [Nonomuraea typhae]
MSIVVPIYDVEAYLPACLESLVAQTWQDFDVVMVDDGSPDDSAAVADRFAVQDRRFRLVRRENGGLGAARNTGVREADGEFLVFLDSDDILPRHALETMVTILDRTGSDFVSGNVHRFTSRAGHPSRMHRQIFLDPRLRTHVTRHDILLKDRQVTNKMWRRSFWDRNGLVMPEGVLYEDTFVALRGHFLATAVDMTSVPVYLWREREEGNLSITQDRASVKAIEDRVGAVRSVRGFLAENGWGAHIDGWDRMVLQSDLIAFLDSLHHGDDGYRARFLDLTGDYLAAVRPRVLANLSADRRVKWELVRQRRIGDLLEFLEWEAAAKPATRVRRSLRSYHLDPPLAVPASVTRLHRNDLEVIHRIDRLAAEDGKLVIEGRATLRYTSPDNPKHQQVTARLVNEATRERIKLPVTTSAARSITALNKDWCGFRIVLDPGALPARAADWHVELTVTHRRRRRSAKLAETPGALPLRGELFETGHGRVWFSWSDAGQFRVHSGREAATVTGHRLDEGRLVFRGDLDRAIGSCPEVVLVRTPGEVVRRCPATVRDGGIEFAVDVRELLPARNLGDPRLDTTASWRAEVPGVGLVSLAAEGARHAVGGRDLIVERAPSGHLSLREQPETLHVDAAEWAEDGSLTLDGSLIRAETGTATLVARNIARGADVCFPVTLTGERARAHVPVLRVPGFAGAVPLPSGTYSLSLRMADGRPLKIDLCLPASAVEIGGRTLRLAVGDSGEATVKIGSDLAKEERGEKRQRRLREVRYPKLREQPLREAVFFDSYSGKRYADSPKAIYEELVRRGSDLEMTWNVRDGQVELPPGLTPVKTNGAAYYEALARSRYIVTNAHLPEWFRRREGQVVVQTWHGTALKRIGFDIENIRFARTDYKERLGVEVLQWTHLVSPSPWSTPVLRRAFRYEGEVVEEGYPRNDVLSRAGAAGEVRERLGLPYGKKVVLYAPTWRDDSFSARGRYRCDLRLDLARMAAELGEDYVFLLRAHPNVTDRPGVAGDRVLDVSTYPDIQELFLVADVLVTDYSSAMFDFAVTGRPMLFYTYDLEHYRDTLRGFYFDFEAEAPGPLLRETGDVIAALAGIGEVEAKYASLYAAFKDRFCPLDDGHAAARVVDRVFRDGQEAAWTSSSSSRE